MEDISINFSVVLTVFNKESYIKNTINSVLAQTYKNFELVIINDGSTDHSKEIIKSFKDERIKLINQKNLGVSAARNKGMSNATFDYICLLDGDDLWSIKFLENICIAIKQYPEQAVFATAIAYKYQNKTIKAKYPFELDGTIESLNYFQHSLMQPLLTASSIAFKKKILKQTGEFNESYVTSEDVDMWIRIGIYFPVVFIKKVMVMYVFNTESLSNTIFDVSQKPKYNVYNKEETKDPHMKKYIDKNRYSLALMSKIHDDQSSFQFYCQQLDLKNLSLKHRLLLIIPKWLIDILLQLKSLKGEKLYYKALRRRKSW